MQDGIFNNKYSLQFASPEDVYREGKKTLPIFNVDFIITNNYS